MVHFTAMGLDEITPEESLIRAGNRARGLTSSHRDFFDEDLISTPRWSL